MKYRETEGSNVKQLGINLSAANLEAFRLEQGLTKSYSAMSQSEQVVLRYQYLMQATADAQGDFARTSDGYANSMRMLETNIENLKTNVGSAILPVINNVVAGLNSMFDAMGGDLPPETVLDKFAAIDLKTAEKIAEIEKTAAKAQATADILAQLSGTTYTADNLTAFVTSFTGSLGTLDEAMAEAEKANYAGTMSAITDALEVKTGTSADDWTKLFSAVGAAIKDADIDPKPIEDDMGAVKDALATPAPAMPIKDAIVEVKSLAETEIDGSTLENSLDKLSTYITKAPPSTDGTIITVIEGITGQLEGAAASIDSSGATFNSYLEAAAAAANSLGPDAAKNWQDLVSMLGDENAEAMLKSWTNAGTASSNVSEFMNSLGSFQGDGSGIATVIQNLKDFGITAVDESAAMETWLGVCQDLVSTIPGLGEIINTQTGELEGGTAAVKAYIAEWENYQKLLAQQQNLIEKRAAIEDDSAVREAGVAVLLAQAKVDAAKATLDALNIGEGEFAKADKNVNNPDIFALIGGASERDKAIVSAFDDYLAAEEELSAAQAEYTRQTEAQAEALALYDRAIENVGENAEQAAESFNKLSADAAASIEEAVTAMAPAAEQMIAMWESTRASIADSVGKMFDGFDFKMPELGKDAPNADSMAKSLQDQIDYIDQYTAALEKLKESGQFSPEFLSNLSSGSEEDFAYLKALENASNEQITQINNKYAEAKSKREEFINSLTETTLEGDDTFTQLAAQVETGTAAIQSALESADLAGAADVPLSALLSTVQSYSTSIGSAIDALLANVQKLEGAGLNGWSGGGSGVNSGNGTPHATGLDYVPFNGYHARLHEGEAILTAEQSRVWRGMLNGPTNSNSALDYGALGGVIRDNAPKAGGDVYLDGRTVGRVISARQADSYRTYERSGYQG